MNMEFEKKLNDTLNDVADNLKDNYLLSSVVVMVAHRDANGRTNTHCSWDGSYYECIGMSKHFEHRMLHDTGICEDMNPDIEGL